MNLLVTGGCGFIGANFCHYWISRHQDDLVVVLDSLTYAGDKFRIDGLNLILQVGDICHQSLIENIFDKYNIDVVVHLAAETHVDNSICVPDEFVRTNILGTHTLLKVARQKWTDKEKHLFYYISTDEVYGSLQLIDPPFDELTKYNPSSPYSASKAAADHLVMSYHKTYQLNTIISHCSNNFGPYQHKEKLIPTVISCAVQGKPIPIYGNGNNIRDWIYVDDHCRAMELIIYQGISGEVYNIGTKNELPNTKIVKMICQLLDQKFDKNKSLKQKYPNSPMHDNIHHENCCRFVTDRPGHDFRYAIDNSKIVNELGFSYSSNFEKKLSQTIDWYLDKGELV